LSVAVRECGKDDLAAVVEILDLKRSNLERFEPALWKQKSDMTAATIEALTALIESERTVALVADTGTGLSGVLIATELAMPAIYNAGPAAVIEDYYVRSPEDWPTIGSALLVEARKRLAKRGYKQVVATSAYKDTAKMVFLREQGLSLAVGSFTTTLAPVPAAP
jgi:hypothetical protein